LASSLIAVTGSGDTPDKSVTNGLDAFRIQPPPRPAVRPLQFSPSSPRYCLPKA